MSQSHPDPQELVRFARGQSSPEATRQVVRHLLAGCRPCREAAGRAWGMPGEAGDLEGSPRDHPGSYQGALEGALRACRGFAKDAAADRRAGPLLCRELLARGSADRLKLACGDPRYASYTLAELLLERCRYQVSADPEDALELGELAVAVSERLSPERFGACASLDLKARCWAVLADARRAGGDTRSAERAVAVAESLFTQGTREPLEKAEILLVKARLRRDQGRHRDAQEILDRTISLYRRHGGARDLGMALLRKGRVLAGLGEWEKAADLLRRGLVKLGKRVEPQVRLPALHDLITCLAELGRAQEAQRWLRRSRALTKELGDPLSELRHRWQAGRVAWVMRRFEEAEAALVECRQGFLEHGQGADAGLLTLELAGLYSERQEPEKVHALGSPEPHEGSLGEARFALEVSTALYLFHRAARTRRASAGLIRQLAHYVSRRRGCEAWVP